MRFTRSTSDPPVAVIAMDAAAVRHDSSSVSACA